MQVATYVRWAHAAVISAFVVVWSAAADDVAREHAPASDQSNTVDFVRDIQPIFESHCVSCHGPDAQEGRLRLDARAIVATGGISGPLLIPGRGVDSRLIHRLRGIGDGDQMPPDDDPLDLKQIELIQRWIDEGAHWPEGIGADATEVDRHWAYIRPERPSMPDLIDGWSRGPIDAFIRDRLRTQDMAPSPPADSAVLIRRLFVDLVGLPPSMEEVDQFIADARPDAFERWVDHLLASPAFGERWARPWLDIVRYADSNGYQRDGHRNVWPYRDWVINALNRDLPFDEFTMDQLAGDLRPNPTNEQRVATGLHRGTTVNVEAGVDQEENRVQQVIDRVNVTGTIWLGTTIECAQCHNHKYDPFTQQDYYRLFAFFNNTQIETAFQSSKATAALSFTGPEMELEMPAAQLRRRKALGRQLDRAREQLASCMADAQSHMADWEQEMADRTAELPKPVAKILAKPAEERSPTEQDELRDHFLTSDPTVSQHRDKVNRLERQVESIQPPTSLVMVEMDKPRETFVFRRGNFLDPAEPVRAGTPTALHPASTDMPANRLGLAQWLVDPANPLVARVTVNRWWAEFWGTGLVATMEDFGHQCDPPTHPELLDWLAVEFMDGDWSMKLLLRQIVESEAYRQTSKQTEEQYRQDPANRWYARGARFRMPAEAIRDHALAAAGMLSVKMGGPPTFPVQPDGVWRVIGQVDNTYRTSSGEDRYRRGIYTVWRRSAPYPSFVTFDAPDRTASCVKRPLTNTPLQALTLLNDEVYVDAARALAERMSDDRIRATPKDRIILGFRRCLGRAPQPRELDRLLDVFAAEKIHLKSFPERARELLGQPATSDSTSLIDTAAYFVVASVLLNLDESITRE